MNRKLYTRPTVKAINLDFDSSLLQSSQEDDPRINVYRRGRDTQEEYQEDDTMW